MVNLSCTGPQNHTAKDIILMVQLLIISIV